jgi:hypothetical protein
MHELIHIVKQILFTCTYRNIIEFYIDFVKYELKNKRKDGAETYFGVPWGSAKATKTLSRYVSGSTIELGLLEYEARTITTTQKRAP